MNIVDVIKHERFENIYWIVFEDGSKKLATISMAPGTKVYGEQLIKFRDKEYRVWNPYRSKLAAAILKSIKDVPIKPNSKVLYLGAASGTTASHVSDIIGKNGLVYCVEFSPRVMRELIERAAKYRNNMIPILADARSPSSYRMFLDGVDVIYADVAQPFQSKIVADNADEYLEENKYIMQAIKAMSIDVTKEPSETYKKEIEHLKERGFHIIDTVHLEPYDIAHAFVLARKK